MITRLLSVLLGFTVLLPVCLLLAWLEHRCDDEDYLDVRPRAPEQNTWPDSEIES